MLIVDSWWDIVVYCSILLFAYLKIFVTKYWKKCKNTNVSIFDAIKIDINKN